MPLFSDFHQAFEQETAPQALTPEQEASKRAMYEKLKPRMRRFIDRIGYENWDPFQKPNDPLDIRQDVTRRTTQDLVREFLQQTGRSADYSNEYGRGALNAALGVVNRDATMLGTFDFCIWYHELLRREGYMRHTIPEMPRGSR